ncbi:MAG TPA: hypothetical protein VGR71_16825 [Nitrospira sp.]|nr:hypothetical protein [Nitrospira sp.]
MPEYHPLVTHRQPGEGQWQRRVLRVTLEFAVDGSLSGGTAIDTAIGEIRKMREVTIIPDGASEPHLYVKPPEILSITLERV